MAVKKPMVCIDCHERIDATIPQAQAHGWKLWVGGARCKGCVERAVFVAEMPPAKPDALVCGRCGHTERWHRPTRCEGYMEPDHRAVRRCTCPGFLHPLAEETP